MKATIVLYSLSDVECSPKGPRIGEYMLPKRESLLRSIYTQLGVLLNGLPSHWGADCHVHHLGPKSGMRQVAKHKPPNRATTKQTIKLNNMHIHVHV